MLAWLRAKLGHGPGMRPPPEAYTAMRSGAAYGDNEGTNRTVQPNSEIYTQGSIDGDETREQRTARRGLAKAIGLLRKRVRTDQRPPLLETRSVYGAAILIPQLARSAGWTLDLLFLTLKVYLFLFLNFLIQFMLLAAIEREESVMDLFSGQMYLCDFGSPIDRCPESPSCLGPGGTKITGPRLYNYQSWAIHKFVKDSLKATFPERRDVIEKAIDVGEYGAESRAIRWLCCFIFMMDVMSELENVVNMGRFFYVVPTAKEAWIDVHRENPHDDDQKPGQREVLGVKVAGMPLFWKVLSVCVILVPKALLWRLTAEAGICFLMETAAIDDMIVNAVGLTFILQVDESICGTLMSSATQELLEECVEYDDGSYEEPPQDAAAKISICKALYSIMPLRLVSTLALTATFILKYYLDHCVWRPISGWFDGWFASKSMYLPLQTDFTIFNTLFPNWFPVPSESEPYWHLQGDQ